MSRFSELKASGTGCAGFSPPRSRGHRAYLACGGAPQANASGETAMPDKLTTSRSKVDAEDATTGPRRTGLPPLAVVALSCIGGFVALALVLNLTRFGSVGRYQMVGSANGQMVVRMDTTTGELSACFGFGLKPPQCFPWADDRRAFKTVPPSQAGQQGDHE